MRPRLCVRVVPMKVAIAPAAGSATWRTTASEVERAGLDA